MLRRIPLVFASCTLLALAGTANGQHGGGTGTPPTGPEVEPGKTDPKPPKPTQGGGGPELPPGPVRPGPTGPNRPPAHPQGDKDPRGPGGPGPSSGPGPGTGGSGGSGGSGGPAPTPPKPGGPSKGPNSGGNGSPPGGLPGPGGAGGSGGHGPPRPDRPVSAMGGKKQHVTAVDSWPTWWALNRDLLLYPLLRMPYRSLTGNGGTEDTRPDATELRDGAVPVLTRALEDADPQVAAAAAIALARIAHCAEPDGRAAIAAAIERRLASSDRDVRQAAIVALGIVGERAHAPTLWGLTLATGDARKVVGDGASLQDEDRALAALASGVLADRISLRALEHVIDSPAENAELRGSALLALGLIEGGNDRSSLVILLGGWLGDEKLDSKIRAQAPLALARLGDDALPLLPALLKGLRDPKEDTAYRRSCALALGKLAAPRDREVVDALDHALDREGDAPLRHLALMACGEIGARGARTGATREDLDAVDRAILHGLVKPRHADSVPFAALAAGVVAAESRSPALTTALVDALREERNPDNLGALAIGCGLARASGVSDDLLQLFRERSEPALQGYLALSLGLLRSRAAEEALAADLDGRSNEVALKDVAAGLVLLRDNRRAKVSDQLVARLQKDPRAVEAPALARSLGEIGDRGALAPLAVLAGDAAQPVALRAACCAALGRMGEPTDLAWNAGLASIAPHVTELDSQRAALAFD